MAKILYCTFFCRLDTSQTYNFSFIGLKICTAGTPHVLTDEILLISFEDRSEFIEMSLSECTYVL